MSVDTSQPTLSAQQQGADLRPTSTTWFSTHLDLLTKASAMLLGATYVTGFMVVALHHAQYGIATFDLLRPKIFSAGALFLIYIFVPAFSASRIFRFRKSFYYTGESVGPNGLLFLQCMDFFLLSYGLAFPWALLFEPLASPHPHVGTNLMTTDMGLVIAVVIMVGVNIATRRKRPRLQYLNSFLLAVAVFASAWNLGIDRIFWLTIWFYVIGLATLVVLYDRDREEKVLHIFRDWERFLPITLIFPLTFFSTRLYSSIKPQFGGGAPRPIVVHFVDEHPFGQEKVSTLVLIDETNQGYYILVSSDDRTSYFVRRDLVKFMAFKRQE